MSTFAASCWLSLSILSFLDQLDVKPAAKALNNYRLQSSVFTTAGATEIIRRKLASKFDMAAAIITTWNWWNHLGEIMKRLSMISDTTHQHIQDNLRCCFLWVITIPSSYSVKFGRWQRTAWPKSRPRRSHIFHACLIRAYISSSTSGSFRSFFASTIHLID